MEMNRRDDARDVVPGDGVDVGNEFSESKKESIGDNEGASETTSLLNTGNIKEKRKIWWPSETIDKKESSKKVIVIEASTVSRGGLIFFDVVQNIATIVSLCLLLSQILPIFFMNDSSTTIGPVQMALRCYMSVFCIGAICAEQEALSINNVPLLKSWILRGLVYSFLGLVGLEESAAINYKTTGTPSLSFEDASVFILMSSFAMVFMGVTYFLMGIMCLGMVRDNLRSKYKSKVEKEIFKREMMKESEIV